MGLFKKKPKEEPESYILDYEVPDYDDFMQSDTEELPITPWEERKENGKKAPHAFTVGEIMGAQPQDTAEADKPAAEIPEAVEETLEAVENASKAALIDDTPTVTEVPTVNAENPQPAAKEIPVAEKTQSEETPVIEKSPIAEAPVIPVVQLPTETPKAEVDKQPVIAEMPEAEETPVIKETTIEETPVIKDTPVTEEKAPIVAETPAVEETADKEDDEQLRTKAFIAELRRKSMLECGMDPDDVKPDETKSDETKTDDVISEEQPAAEPKSENHGVTLSPKAQILYNQMMARRAKDQLKKQPDAAQNTPDEDIPLPESEKSAEPTQSEEVKTPTESVKFPSAKGEAEIRNDESVADAIFNSLTGSMKDENPLIRKKDSTADSLLNKCKSYISDDEPEYKPDSIDDIIHNAEKGARERLSNLYESDSLNPPTGTTGQYDLSLFARHRESSEKGDEKQVSMPLKIVDDETADAVIRSSGNVKNFQYSFADNPENIDGGDTEKTVTIDISSSTEHTANADGGHVTDPVRAETMRFNLSKLAEDEPEDTPEKFNLTGTSEDELPDSDISDYTDDMPQLDDYKTIDDATSMRCDLASKGVSILARLLPTALLTVILAVIDFAFKDAFISGDAVLVFSLINVIIFGIITVINFNTLKGIGGIIFGSPDMDSPCAVAMICTLIYTVFVGVAGNVAKMPCLAPVGAMAVLFNLVGKNSVIKRIRRGFEIIATDETKRAVTFVEDRVSSSVMANGSVVGEALIAVGKQTTNVGDYLKNSYREDPYEKNLSPFIITTLIVAAVFALAGFFFGGLETALIAFAAVTIIACPPTSLLCCNMPLGFAAKNLEYYGASLAGCGGADTLSNANAVAFDAIDIFPEGTIKLYGMKVLSNNAVDDYIKAAASILKSANSPLTPVFEEVAMSSGDAKLPDTDSIKYENGMGISGWIGEHRVFIGNRTLMEGHSIPILSLEVDKKILHEGYFPVYLAVDQKICALFVVGYEADPNITYELRRLCNTGVTMFVNSNDPNISDEMLCDYFGLYKNTIKVLTPTGVTAYKAATVYKETVPSPSCFTDNICGFLAAVTASIRLKSIMTLLLVIQLVGICLSVALLGYFIAVGTLVTSATALLLLGSQLVLAALISFIAYLKQP